MEVKFVKMNPTQNMTILVESEVETGQRSRVACELMDYASIFAEQVGFIEKPRNSSAWARLQMMGGEFCGNATMSLAALLALDKRLPHGQEVGIPVECSGAGQPVIVTVIPDCNSAICSLELPPPHKVEKVIKKVDANEYQVTQVDLDGITHFIVQEEIVAADHEQWAEKAIRQWAADCRTEALGLMLHRRGENYIRPLVMVKPTDSLVWERGCGSGTAAVGSTLAWDAKKSIKAGIGQPGGVISVQADYEDERIVKVFISGQVKLSARGMAYLD